MKHHTKRRHDEAPDQRWREKHRRDRLREKRKDQEGRGAYLEEVRRKLEERRGDRTS